MAGGVQCVRGVLGDAAEALSDDEISQTLDDLQRRARRRQERQPLDSLERALLDEAEEVAADIELQGMIERRNAAMNEVIYRRTIEFAETFNEADPSMGLEARMVGVNLARQGGRMSADSRAKALEGRLGREMIGRLRQEGLLEFMTRRSGGPVAWLRGGGEGPLDRQIAQELWEIDLEGGRPGVSGSREAQRIAKIIHSYQEAARQMQNRAGAFIRSMPGYVARQSHDEVKIRNAGLDEWRAFVRDRLDPDRTFDGADPDVFLEQVWNALSSGVHHRTPTEAPLLGFKGPANLGRRVSQERVLHFKSADDWMAYNRRFGQGSLINSVMFGLRRAAQDTALLETFGSNPRAMFDRVRADLQQRHRTDQKKLSRLGRNVLGIDRLENQWAEIDGSTRIPGNLSFARVGAWVRAGQTLSKLGMVTLSAFSDIPLYASEARYQGRGLLSGFSGAVDNVVQGRRSGDQRRIADVWGAGMDGMMGDIHARFANEDGPPGVMTSLINAFFKLNLLSWWTDAHKTGVALAMSRDLAFDAQLRWSELSPERRRLMEQFEISERDWDLLRTNAVREAADGRLYMMPDLIREVADDVLPDGTPRQRRRARDELETRLRTMVADRVDFAVLTPGARERAILNQGTRIGTLGGEGLRAMTQFKSFPLAMVSRPLGREAFARGAPNIWSAIFRGRGDIVGLAGLIVSMTAFGFLSMTLKDLAKGRTPRDPEDLGTWGAAFAQGGGAGIYGDFLLGEYNRFGQGVFETTLGPTAGSISELARLYSDALDGEASGAQAFRLVQGHVPGINLFYTRMALDFLILHQIQEMLSPGSLRRMEQRVREQNNQTFYLPPSQAIPYGGGDRLFEGVRG